jgi:hypothetical protein
VRCCCGRLRSEDPELRGLCRRAVLASWASARECSELSPIAGRTPPGAIAPKALIGAQDGRYRVDRPEAGHDDGASEGRAVGQQEAREAPRASWGCSSRTRCS